MLGGGLPSVLLDLIAESSDENVFFRDGAAGAAGAVGVIEIPNGPDEMGATDTTVDAGVAAEDVAGVIAETIDPNRLEEVAPEESVGVRAEVSDPNRLDVAAPDDSVGVRAEVSDPNRLDVAAPDDCAGVRAEVNDPSRPGAAVAAEDVTGVIVGIDVP